MAQILREESEKWLEILQYFADHGALGPQGCRERQAAISKKMDLNPKNFGYYLRAMEQLGVISVRRTTVDGNFASPRGFNIYTLHCTPERWRDQLGPAVARERRARVTAQRAVLNRNNAREQKRRRLQAKLDELGPDPDNTAPAPKVARSASPRAPAAPPPEPEASFAPDELASIVERFADPNADLTGW